MLSNIFNLLGLLRDMLSGYSELIDYLMKELARKIQSINSLMNRFVLQLQEITLSCIHEHSIFELQHSQSIDRQHNSFY